MTGDDVGDDRVPFGDQPLPVRVVLVAFVVLLVVVLAFLLAVLAGLGLHAVRWAFS